MKKYFILTTAILLCLSAPAYAYKYEDIISTDEVGEAFGEKVPKEVFLYYYKTASLFTRAGKEGEGTKERDEDRVRQEAWQDLIFAKEAKKLGITVDKEELKKELERLMGEKDIKYGTKEYALWVVQNFNEDPGTFDRRIEDLLLVNKFVKMKMDPEVTVTEEECKEKFLNQYNSFESEYIMFEDQKKAEEFAEAVKKNPKLWKEAFDKKKAEAGQKGAAWINIMSLEALIDLWKIPKEDAYRVLNGNRGDFIVGENYYGDCVFRLLFNKKADLKEYNEKKKQYYMNMLTQSKKYKIAKDYFEDLFKRAALRDYIKEKEDARKKEQMKKKSLIALETNRGTIELKLFSDIAPLACENFIGLVEKGYYNGVTFHRVIKDFMIQSGDPTGTGSGGESIWGKPFADEVNDKTVFDRPGILAMANSGSDTNTSQFFITTAPTPWLNKKHTIFGEVAAGMDVVKKINEAPADSNNKPKEEQKIIRAYIKGEAK